MASRRPPSIRLRRLATELRRLRVAAALKQEDVAVRTGLDASSIYRIERAMNKPQRRTVTTLLDLYGVTDPDRRATLLEWLKDADQQAWMKQFTPELPDVYSAFVGFEHEAERLRAIAPTAVPALLQTEDYARALLSEGAKVFPHDVERSTAVRIHRQSILTRPSPVAFCAILDEAVIRRIVGGPRVMRAQLNRLVSAAGQRNVTLRIVPFSAGPHLGLGGTFVMLDFPDPHDRPLVYTESIMGISLLDAETDVARFAHIFATIEEHALSPGSSRTLIEDAARALA
ncbi:helix-turn-helix domain-containing protein [Actinoplanes aureus]|uniref:Helix-turn-helix domain-containing protein n=1 Tax=Actinoplanes aureus TaxID=2792083 RepID=A0A931G2P3_9ACTN|nr:helix-turn-helix transcriptional regulator [Actinoplanes aureus]MBG0566296.1 helix-turn-helix domain-containing protein [Actinoplanes aureus]